MINNYKKIDPETWSGRIDSENDYDAFRWHQWVKFLDLNEETKPFNGKLAFAFLGFKSDIGIKRNKGRQGAFNGPEAIRKELFNKPCNFSKEVELFDAGDIVANENISLEEAQESLSQGVKRLLELNYFPILLGGGHEIVFGHYKGIFDFFRNKEKKANIGIINFDAHFDNRPYEIGNVNSGTMFRQIHDLTKECDDEYKYMVIGIQKSANTVSLFKYADESNTKYILAKEVAHGDIYMTFEKIDEFIREVDHLYITLDIDVVQSSAAPGVSAPQPLGLDPELIAVLLKYVLTSEKAISFDIAEVSPRFDHDNTTASLAAIYIFTLVTKLSTWVH